LWSLGGVDFAILEFGGADILGVGAEA